MHTRALIEREGRIFNRSYSAWKRQKPTRIPYSCQLQFGTSGRVVTPVGGTSTCRGMGRAMSHTSTFTIVQITTRSPFGKCSFGRSTIAEYFARSLGRVIRKTAFGNLELASGARHKSAKVPLWSVSGAFAPCQQSLTLTAITGFFRIYVVFV